MKKLFKTSIFLLIIVLFFQSCSEDEQNQETEDTQITPTSLEEKIIATATSFSDFNLINSLNCIDFGNILAHFSNPEGDSYGTSILSLEDWDTQYNAFKEMAFQNTGIQFSDEDFIIDAMTVDEHPAGEIFFYGEYVYTKEQFLDYYEDCYYDGVDPLINNKVFLSEINFDCDGIVNYFVGQDSLFPGEEKQLSDGLNDVENQLSLYNLNNNTTYTTDDIYIYGIKIALTNSPELLLFNRIYLLNYFENCQINRDNNENDCLNFLYPISVNQINLPLEETIIIENDEELATLFNTEEIELELIYPISLVDINGNTTQANNNNELDTILGNSFNYCQ